MTGKEIIDILVSKNLTSPKQVKSELNKILKAEGAVLTKQQQEIFVKAFCDKYLPEPEIDTLFEEPEDEIEVIKKKIEAYKEKLQSNPANRISIISMISKLRKKLRDLGYETETISRASGNTIESLKAKLEQLELDLALAPTQKVRSIQSMISKIKKKLRELGDTTFVKQPKEKVVKLKLSPAELIGLNAEHFENALSNSDFDESEPFNKSIIVFLKQYAKDNEVSLTELAKYVLKYQPKYFSDLYCVGNPIAELIEKQTLKNISKLVKSTKSLSIDELNTLNNSGALVGVDEKLLRKVSKLSSINLVNKFLGI